MMELTKENYEFLMFELLEGNLSKTEKNDLLEQINSSSFYQREWALMQHAVIEPSGDISMFNNENLLKPVGQSYSLVWFKNMSKVAASLLFIGAIGWFIYTNTHQNEVAFINKPGSKINSPQPKLIEKVDIDPNANKIKLEANEQLTKLSRNTTPLDRLNPIMPIDKMELKDSTAPAFIPEIIILKGKSNEDIAYEIKPNEVSKLDILNIEAPHSKPQNKYSQLLSKAVKYTSLAQNYWNDIPNLKLKITPKLKERNIGIELKGDTIYASAIVEIK